jgi:CheY-like chemotaxis protein
VKKDFFGKWRKEAVTVFDDDQQRLEGSIILERMASIITPDKAKKKESSTEFKFPPEESVSDSAVAIDKSETRTSTGTLDIESGKDKLSTEYHDKSESHREAVTERITVHSTRINKDASLILIVEDEPVTQRLLKKILEDRGYEVVMASDGIDALMEIGKRDYDLILSDLSMPNLDGFKLLDVINLKGIRSPVIFLTGSDDVEDEIKVLALGAKDYIRKPINRDLLLLRISKALNN